MTNSFCYHPFNGLDIDNNGTLKPCCKFKSEMFDGWKNYHVKDGITSYLQSDQIQKLQQQFKNNEKPDACIRCWHDENAGLPSKRQLDSPRWTFDENDNQIKFLSIPIGNLCNLKCRICSPISSSSWIKEYFDLYQTKMPIQDWHKDKAVWKEIIKISQGCVEIHIHGGEPFLYSNTEHQELIESIVESGNADHIQLHYSTNGTQYPTNALYDAWNNFKRIDIQVSIDDMGKRFEYNRHPAVWNEVKENLQKYRLDTKKYSNHQLSISTTVSVFTVYYLDEFMTEMFKMQMPRPWLGRLHSPIYYRPSIFKKDAKVKIIEKLLSSKHQSVNACVSWLENDDSDKWDQFLKIVNAQDQYRKEKFVETFPELAIITNMK